MVTPRYALAMALLLPGCANTPGEPGLDRPASSDPAQIERTKIDRATCVGEAAKADAKAAIKTKQSFDDAYDGCMAKRGYGRQ